MATSNENLTSREAQEMFARLATAALRQIDIAVNSRAIARDRKRARARLERALSTLSSDPKKI